jgi:hypothetical protein
MRPLPFVMVALAALAGGAALPGCPGTQTCNANADCPMQSYCELGDAGAAGTCRQDCRATPDCRDPMRRCSSLGRCVPVEIPLTDAGVDAAPLEDAAPADGVPAGDATPD